MRAIVSLIQPEAHLLVRGRRAQEKISLRESPERPKESNGSRSGQSRVGSSAALSLVGIYGVTIQIPPHTSKVLILLKIEEIALLLDRPFPKAHLQTLESMKETTLALVFSRTRLFTNLRTTRSSRRLI